MLYTVVYTGQVMAPVSLMLYKPKHDLKSISLCLMSVTTVIVY